MSKASTEFAAALVTATPRPTLHVCGELDLVTAPQLRDRLDSLIERSTGSVAVDLAQVRFLDAAGLSALVDARQRLHAVGRRLTISRASTKTLRVLRLAGLSTLFDAAEPLGDVTTT